jgi:acyl-coenzyme A thioesterase 13
MAYHDLIGMTVDASDDGGATAAIDAGPHHLNRHGTVHGGVLASLADAAMGAALVGASHGEQDPVTVSLTVTYLEPAPDGPLTATARIRRLGGRLTIAEADIAAGDGTIVATALGTFASLA